MAVPAGYGEYVIHRNGNAHHVYLDPADSLVNDPNTETLAAYRARVFSESQAGRKVQALDSWHAAVANRDFAPARWYALGDSLTEGGLASSAARRWVNKALGLTRHRFPTEALSGGGVGFLPPRYTVTSLGNPYSSVSVAGVGTVAPTNGTTWGIGRRGSVLPAGAFYEYTVQATSVVVNYAQTTTGGNMSVSIDGGAAVTVSTLGAAGSVDTDGKTWTSPALAAGSHTVRVTGSTGSPVFTGLTVFNGDENKGLQIYEAGHSGSTTGWWLESTGWTDTIGTVQPHLVTIALLTNDYAAGTDPATSKANLLRLIQAVRDKTTVDPSIVLVFYPKRTDLTTSAYTWEEYARIAHDIAATNSDVTILDLSREMEGPTPNTLGLWNADKIHPTDKGHSFIANAVAGFVSPA